MGNFCKVCGKRWKSKFLEEKNQKHLAKFWVLIYVKCIKSLKLASICSMNICRRYQGANKCTKFVFSFFFLFSCQSVKWLLSIHFKVKYGWSSWSYIGFDKCNDKNTRFPEPVCISSRVLLPKNQELQMRWLWSTSNILYKVDINNSILPCKFSQLHHLHFYFGLDLDQQASCKF